MASKKGDTMKTDIHRLKVVMHDRGETVISISKKLNINRSTFYRWTKSGFESIPLGKVYELIEILNLNDDDINDIFLLREYEKN